ncbi:MAG: arginine repressor [Christensenellales bacterium]
MNKKHRQQLILDIIGQFEIDTQEELVAMLQSKGCEVTQATASRDVKELELVKVSGREKRYRYAQVGSAGYADHTKYGNIFRESVVSLQRAKNLIVIKTVHGGANSAAAFIDNMALSEVLGSIAGDDTIFIVTPDDESAQRAIEQLKSCF